MPITALLSSLILASAVVTIWAEYRGPRLIVYCFKPLTTGLILLLALRPSTPRLPPYQYAVVAGLVCSLVGDVVLMLPKRRLFPGLVSFLMAHMSYIVAFSWGVRLSGSPLLVTPFFVFLVVVSVILLPHLGRMKVPVIAYELVILTMAWRALERWFQVESVSAFLAFLGALMFIFSDSLHGIRDFVRKFRIAQALILGTYFCAQWLIALSV